MSSTNLRAFTILVLAIIAFHAKANTRCVELFDTRKSNFGQDDMHFFPAASKANIVAPSEVSNFDKKIKVAQSEVPTANYSDHIQWSINQAISLSRWNAAKGNVEVGFFVAVTERKIVVQFVTSQLSDGILSVDLDKAVDLLFKKVDPSGINRVQFYHTHPQGLWKRSLSRADIDEGLRLHFNIIKRLNRKLSFDIHAIPADLAVEGQLVYERPPPEKPIIVSVSPTVLRATLEAETTVRFGIRQMIEKGEPF